MGHLWVFSPLFFILVWEVNPIVQSSVAVFAVFVNWCRSSFVSTLYVSYQSYGWTEGKPQESPERPNSEK